MDSHGLKRAASICPGPALYFEIEPTGCLVEAQILVEDDKSLLDGLEQGPINTLATRSDLQQCEEA